MPGMALHRSYCIATIFTVVALAFIQLHHRVHHWRSIFIALKKCPPSEPIQHPASNHSNHTHSDHFSRQCSSSFPRDQSPSSCFKDLSTTLIIIIISLLAKVPSLAWGYKKKVLLEKNVFFRKRGWSALSHQILMRYL